MRKVFRYLEELHEWLVGLHERVKKLEAGQLETQAEGDPPPPPPPPPPDPEP